MTNWTLEGHGRRPWSDVRALLDGYTCAWVDRYQLRVGAAPDEPPITTHLWGWADGRYARVRVDGGYGYVGVLWESPAGPGDPVSVIARAAVMREDAEDRRVELLEVPGPGPVTFIRPWRG